MTPITKARIVNFILFAFIILFAWLWNQSRENTRDARSNLITYKESAKFWQDKDKRSNAEIESLHLDKKTFRKFHEDKVDSFKRAGIKIKHIEKLVTITKVTRDTVILTDGRFADEWSEFSNENDTLFYSLKDSVSLITHEKPYGFLNLKNKYVTRVISHNPHSILIGVTSSEIVPKQRRISVGLYTGYGLTLAGEDLKAGWQVGGGLTFKIF